MARVAAKALSARQVETEKRVGFHADAMAMGLYLQVAPARGPEGVSRSFVFRYTSPTLKKRRAIGLGSARVRKLADARRIAMDYRRALLDGIDPKQRRDDERDAAILAGARSITFDDAATKYIAVKEPEWRNVKHARQWRNTLTTYASPVLGKLPVDRITTDLVLRVLDPIWKTKTETASRVRQRIEKVLEWAHEGFRNGANPARLKGGVELRLPRAEKIKKVRHHPAVPYVQTHAFAQALRGQGGVGALALEFMLLTAARTGEVIAARWDELDLERAIWTVPAERMKAGREHRVPLCHRALEILEKLASTRQNEYVFPAHSTKGRNGHISNGTCLVAMKRLRGFEQYTPHGLRSTFRDWASETPTGFDHDTLELALAHTITNKAEAAYRRGDQLEKRARLMQQWQAYIETQPAAGHVVQLRKKAH